MSAQGILVLISHLLCTEMSLIIFTNNHILEGNASWQTISARFVWPGMASDIKQWTRTCIRCQTTKVNKHTKALLSSFPPPDVDLVGPLDNIEGYEYILTIIDRFTH